jgi:hypothetical protein
VPVATHEIFPASLVGVDNTEHTAATSRRGYSPKMATQQTAYEDVVQLFGQSARIFCPMISGAGTRRLFERDPALKNDPRFTLYPGVDPAPGGPAAGGGQSRRRRRPARRQRQDGARHHEGRRPRGGRHRHAQRREPARRADVVHDGRHERVRRAEDGHREPGAGARPRTPARSRPGSWPIIIVIDGDPLANIAATARVRHVIANGRPYNVEELVGGAGGAPTARGR